MKTRSLSAHYRHTTPGSSILLACVDLRTTAQKIEDLKSEMRQTSSKNKLDNLLLMQVYVKLEYGDISIENARAYLRLSQYYFQRKLHFLAQAKFHAMNAHQILEQLRIQPNDDRFQENQLAYDIYFMLVQCSLNAKQREMKSNNKHILSIDKTHIEHDLKKLEKYLDKLKNFLKQSQFKKLQKEFLLLKFDSISMNTRKYNPMIFQIIEQILNLFSDNIQFQIRFYQRCGLYLINFEESESDGLMYYRKSVELADKQHFEQPSIDNKYELANAILQRNIAKIQRERLTNEIESEFQRAIQFYRQPTGDMSKNVLKIIDELANYYVKIEKYQDALNVLCESLADKRRLFGEFSEEIIQTESRIGAIYGREGENLNAYEHLKTCLELEEFVYGLDDSRTMQTRTSIKELERDPIVVRKLSTRKQDRPTTRNCKKESRVKNNQLVRK